MWLFSMPIGWMADWLIETQRLSVKNVRRICNSIGHYGSALGMYTDGQNIDTTTLL